METYSISFRLRRTTTETAFIKVPVTDDILLEQPDGTARIDPEKIVQRVIELGKAPEVLWQSETQQVEPHPIQTPPPWAKESSPLS
jgi:hypothetical protein